MAPTFHLYVLISFLLAWSLALLAVQTEQAKQFDPEYGREGGDDEWGDALGYMEALAGGLNLQIARTISAEQYASLPLVSPTLSNSMLLDASIKEVGGGCVGGR